MILLETGIRKIKCIALRDYGCYIQKGDIICILEDEYERQRLKGNVLTPAEFREDRIYKIIGD